MVSRLFGSNPFDESVEKATSEKGQEDLALNLEISDQIRSKQVQPKDAMRALKRKITHTNPSVQLLALSLTDTCVKNGGQHFLIEIASREFVDSLVGIVKAPPSACSPDVKSKLLGLIQTWALAFEGKPELIYVTETYRLLKHEGYVFPKVDKKSTSNMLIDTATPPEWSDSDYCVRCRTPFTLMNRKHHCRNCGQTFCGECSSKTAPLPNIGINEPVRVCDACFIKRQLKTKGPENRHQTLYSGFPITNGNDNRESSESEEDEDYKKAIELSLKEKEKVTRRESIKQLEQTKEEEDLAAAIAESLKDTKPRYPTRTQPTSIDILDTQKEQNEISEIEADNIHKFSDLLERIQQSGSDLIRNRQVQELHDRIGELKPKLTKNLTETIQRHQDLVEMHEKLSRVIKLYDRLLEDRMSNTYSRHSSSSIYAGVTSPVSSNAGIVVHPSIQQPPANLYQNSLYPLASAPSPSPTYFPPQVSHTQYAQPSTLEIVPILNQPPLPSLQQISYGTVGAVGAVGTVSYLPQQTFQNFDANSGFTQIQQNQSSQPNNYYNHPPQDPSSQLIVHQQPQKVEEASLIEL